MSNGGGSRQPISGQGQLLSEKKIGELLDLKLSTLRMWRCRGIGPPHYKIEGSVRYDLEELVSYLEKCRRLPSVRAASEKVAHEPL